MLWTLQVVHFSCPGNEYLHQITSQGHYTIRFDLGAFNGSTAFATYTNFSVASESNKYKHVCIGYDGTAGEYKT